LNAWTLGWSLTFFAGLTFSSALMEIAFACLLGGWVLQKTQEPLVLPFERRVFFTLLGFVLLSVLSYFWSEYPPQSFRGIFKILQQFFTFWILSDILRGQKRLRLLGYAAISLVLLLGVDGMWQYVTGSDLLRQIPYEPHSSGPRLSASFKNYALLASFLVTFIPVLFSPTGPKEKSQLTFLRSLATLLGLLILFWTRTRGAWIAFFVSLVFLLILKKKIKALLILAGLGLASLVVLPSSMVLHLDTYGREQSMVERYYLWDRAAQVIRARPLTGTGINTYAVAHQKYDQRQSWRVRNYYAHNGYLQIAAETGIPSLLFFLAFLFFYFRNAIEWKRRETHVWKRRRLEGILAGLVGFLTFAAIDTVLHNEIAVMAFWLLAGWGNACQNTQEN